VLAQLARFDARATFFVLGEKVRAAPEVLREIAMPGTPSAFTATGTIGLFSLRHPNRMVADIERAQAAVAASPASGHRCFARPSVT
jgi:peptidoglycan/xylan/chitin deacetylase (PgdA/CDA1 family)